jgi:hypothetical protein
MVLIDVSSWKYLKNIFKEITNKSPNIHYKTIQYNHLRKIIQKNVTQRL